MTHPAHPARTSHAWPRVPLAVAIAVVLVLAIPLKVRCGAPGMACATAVDARGNTHYYYEVEPLGVYIGETFSGSNIPIYYRSGEDLQKVR